MPLAALPSLTCDKKDSYGQEPKHGKLQQRIEQLLANAFEEIRNRIQEMTVDRRTAKPSNQRASSCKIRDTANRTLTISAASRTSRKTIMTLLISIFIVLHNYFSKRRLRIELAEKWVLARC